MAAMSADFACRLTWGVYHLFLGTWFGAMVMLVVAAGITFATVRQYQPTIGIEPYRELTEIESQPKYPLPVRILAGGIVGNVLKGLVVVQTLCAVVVVICLAVQWICFPGPRWADALRTLLIVAPIVVLAVDVTVLSPRVWRERSVMYDPAMPQPQRVEAHARFQKLHKLSERMVGMAALSLGAALVLSAWALPLAARAGVTDGG